jgi:hypothetical protein
MRIPDCSKGKHLTHPGLHHRGALLERHLPLPRPPVLVQQLHDVVDGCKVSLILPTWLHCSASAALDAVQSQAAANPPFRLPNQLQLLLQPVLQ